MFCLFLAPVVWFFKPTPTLCIIRLIIAGLLYTISLAVTLTKTQKCIYIFHSPIKLTHKEVIISNAVEVFAIFLCCGTYVCLSIMLFLYVPTSVIEVTNAPSFSVYVRCDTSKHMLLQLLYLLVLAAASMVQGFRARNIPEKYGETKSIYLSMFAFIIITIMLIFILLSSPFSTYEAIIDCIIVMLPNLIMLIALYGTKIFITLFLPHKNRKKTFKIRLSLKTLKSSVSSQQ